MITICPARVKDAPVLARIHVDSWRAAYRGLVPASSLERFSYQWREERIYESLAGKSEKTYLIREDEHAVGLLTLSAALDVDPDSRRTGEIRGIYLLPSHWRKGIGRRVIEEAKALLSAWGYGTIILWVLEENQPARLFYKAMGFVPDGASKIVEWGAPLVAIRYRKELPPPDASQSQSHSS